MILLLFSGSGAAAVTPTRGFVSVGITGVGNVVVSLGVAGSSDVWDDGELWDDGGVWEGGSSGGSVTVTIE